jgi:hypothetical protein
MKIGGRVLVVVVHPPIPAWKNARKTAMPDASATPTDPSLFDRWATYTSEWVSRPSFFVTCVQNTQSRSNRAVQRKLNAIADALGCLTGELDDERSKRRIGSA